MHRPEAQQWRCFLRYLVSAPTKKRVSSRATDCAGLDDAAGPLALLQFSEGVPYPAVFDCADESCPRTIVRRRDVYLLAVGQHRGAVFTVRVCELRKRALC